MEDPPRTLCSMPDDSIEIIILHLHSYADFIALYNASRVFWQTSSHIRAQYKILLKTSEYIRQRYGDCHRCNMERTGLIAHTKNIHYNTVKEGIESWNQTPIQWKSKFTVPFGSYTTNQIIHIHPYTSKPTFKVIELTVQSVMELLWMKRAEDTDFAVTDD